MTDSSWLSAADAARRLGVKRETLYAYVSRGLIRSRTSGTGPRARQYARDDVERARRRAEDRRDPASIATHALDLGSPVLESAITLIEDGALYYRGHDAIVLSRTRAVSEVASLIWTGRFDALPNAAAPRPAFPTRRGADLGFLARAQVLLAAANSRDPLAFDLQSERVVATGVHIMDLMAYAATGARGRAESVEAELASAWKARRSATDVLRAAIILCADHELNVSAFTARCVASAGGSAYGAVTAGICALEGVRHGGLTARVESMLAAMRQRRNARSALGDWLHEGEHLHGFGHPLYPKVDPRAAELLRLMEERYPRSPELAFSLEIADSVWSHLSIRPSVDFALATVSRTLRLPPGSALTLFAIGRTIGWIGHALEQYATGKLIRPRAKYIAR